MRAFPRERFSSQLTLEPQIVELRGRIKGQNEKPPSERKAASS